MTFHSTSQGTKERRKEGTKMTNGAIALGDVAARASHIEVACSRCERRGRYQVAKLVETLGPEFPMTDLGAELASCPHRGASAHHERCDVFFPGLRKLMYGDDPAAHEGD